MLAGGATPYPSVLVTSIIPTANATSTSSSTAPDGSARRRLQQQQSPSLPAPPSLPSPPSPPGAGVAVSTVAVFAGDPQQEAQKLTTNVQPILARVYGSDTQVPTASGVCGGG